MRGWMMFLGLAGLPVWVTLGAAAPEAHAQLQGGGHMGRARATQLGPRTPRRFRTLVSDGSRRRRGRLDQLRAMVPLRRDRRGLLADPRLAQSPIKRLLDEHNLLRSRSFLGKQTAAHIGRQDYLPDDSGVLRGDISRWPGAPRTLDWDRRVDAAQRIEEGYVARLARKADDSFELGIGYFRNHDLLHARHCFGVARDLQRDRPRAFLGEVFVSVERGEYNRATLSLLHALERAETLDDLRIEGFIERLYEGDDFKAKQRAFRRTVESINILVNSQADAASQLKLLLAYYAWLNGDMVTAVAATEIPGKALDASVAPEVEKFRKLLIAAKDEASAALRGP